MNILILNVHSALNLGDDAIMHATLRGLQDLYPTATITVAANDPDSWRKFKRVRVVGSLTTWVVDRDGGRWHWNKPRLVLYTLFLPLASSRFSLAACEMAGGHNGAARIVGRLL